MADKTTTLKTKTNDNVYPNIIGDNMDNAIVDSAHINHTLTADHKINFRLDTNVSGLIFNSLQKPSGLTKTKLVGVGTNGQENIEIGDNLTLANGKLSATGGGGGIQITNQNTLFPTFKFEAKAYNIGDEVNLNDNPIISYNPDKGEIMRPYAISQFTPSVIKLENNALIFIVIPRFYYSDGSDGTVYKTTYRAVCIKEGTLTSSQIVSYTGNTYKVSITN